jgi:cytidylate kinase
MAVITISRGSFSGGKMLAECLADRLGYRCIDRDAIVEKAAAYGVSQEDLRAALNRPPTFWDRFTHGRYVYLTLIQAALTAEVREGKAIYHGNAGHLLLRGVSHVLRTRIIAPMPFRQAMVQDRLRLGPTEALAYVQKTDQDRRKWTQYLYGVDWGDPALYDLVLNLEYLDISQACDVIVATARQDCFAETPESRAAMDDLVLASRIRANLVITPETANIEVDVAVHGGAAVVKGKLSNRDQVREVQAVVRRVPGVTSVDLDLLTAVDT